MNALASRGDLMAKTELKSFKLVGFDEGSERQSRENENLRLTCLIDGDGILAVWGSPGNHKNIDTVLAARMPCEVECECIPAKDSWTNQHGHKYWVPERGSLRVIEERPR
jgi:hypothetical protein